MNLKNRKLWHKFPEKIWYSDHPIAWLLRPFSLIYQLITQLRRFYLCRFRQKKFSVPIIVVGNITVGGVGKTPLVIALAQQLQERGLRVGIVSRGYGAKISHYPHEVKLTESAALVGDEPLLLAQKACCPVVIAPKRVAAVEYLIARHQVEIIISDDGLQHYQMGRTIEILVLDGLRFFGNGLCLPAGPLRESRQRLATVDFVVVNGASMPGAYRMDLVVNSLTNLLTGMKINDLSALPEPIAAVAAIGNPERFFASLRQLGLKFIAYAFADHHNFQPHELNFSEKIVVMTEKDAVKCHAFADENMYFLPVQAVVCNEFWEDFWLHKALIGCY